ncbi:hypothetical protein FH972_023558 [Carpinus fangiana]|uniref:Oxidoreductase-like domain-containing protein n=1 Tax=Carpinus fangiana TaxID=176857 RepID=A0A5N6KVW9_9ROSI|nr:hypothetical protein FH972_023558 [Carpinus fangiana]
MAPTDSSTTFDPRTRSPTLQKLLKTRLAPIREEQLITSAKSPQKPVKPPAGDCCGSSCNPCVMDLYREELKCWKECWTDIQTETENAAPKDNLLQDQSDSSTDVVSGHRKMPGSFECPWPQVQVYRTATLLISSASAIHNRQKYCTMNPALSNTDQSAPDGDGADHEFAIYNDLIYFAAAEIKRRRKGSRFTLERDIAWLKTWKNTYENFDMDVVSLSTSDNSESSDTEASNADNVVWNKIDPTSSVHALLNTPEVKQPIQRGRLTILHWWSLGVFVSALLSWMLWSRISASVMTKITEDDPRYPKVTKYIIL